MAVAFKERGVFVIPRPPETAMKVIASSLIHYALTTSDGSELLALPIHGDVSKLLRNLEIPAGGCHPFEVHYPVPSNAKNQTAWWWQLVTARFLIDNKRAFCTSTPRTGKTFSTLMAIDYLQRFEKFQAALIVVPLTVANKAAWHKAAAEWLPHLRLQLVHKDREADLDIPADIYLINPEAVKLVETKLQRMIDLGKINIVVVDELTEFSNCTRKRWKALNNAMRNAVYRWGLTGSPGSSQKIYDEVKLINPANVPATKSAWRSMTQVKGRKIKNQVSKYTNKLVEIFEWKDRPDVDEIIKKAMQPCIRFVKEEVMSIPQPQVLLEEVPLSAEQLELTETLRTHLCLDDGVTALQRNTLAQKLMQVANGMIINDDDSIREIDATPKLERLMEILRRTPRKKVVYSNYIATNDLLVRKIQEAGFTCAKIDGGVTGKKRSQLLHDFMETPEPHVLVCHPRTTAYGVELASADYIICYGTPLCGTYLYQQLFERLSSSRQTAEETFVVHLSAGKQDTVSRDALLKGSAVEQDLVNLFNYKWE